MERVTRLRLLLLGVGAMASPRYAPAGLLISYGRHHVVLDGGDMAPPGSMDAWLVTDAQCELIASIRRLARQRGLITGVARFEAPGLVIEPHPVVHTSHPAFGYRIDALVGARHVRVVWAPEFFEFPAWAARADLMFAEAASYSRPIGFAGGVGGHMPALAVGREARRHRVRRLVFAHIGRSSIRARDSGAPLPFGEWGNDGESFVFERTSPSVSSPRPVSRLER